MDESLFFFRAVSGQFAGVFESADNKTLITCNPKDQTLSTGIYWPSTTVFGARRDGNAMARVNSAKELKAAKSGFCYNDDDKKIYVKFTLCPTAVALNPAIVV